MQSDAEPEKTPLLSILFGPEKESVLLNASLTVQEAILILIRHSVNPKATAQETANFSLFDGRLSSSALPPNETLQQCGVQNDDILDGES